MAAFSGQYGKVVFTPNAGESGIALTFSATCCRWQLDFIREMKNLTPLSQASQAWAPEHYGWVAVVKAYVDGETSPGLPNHLIADVSLFTNFPLEAQYYGDAWVERQRVTVDLNQTVWIDCVLRGTGPIAFANV